MRIERIHQGCPVGAFIKYARHYGQERPGVVPASTWGWRLIDGQKKALPLTVHRSQIIKGGKHERRRKIAQHIKLLRLLMKRGEFDPPRVTVVGVRT